jgi:hypothetical protein
VYHCRKNGYGITGIHNNSVLQQILKSGANANAELLSEGTDFTTLIVDSGS